MSTQQQKFTAIADAIRAKKGTTDLIVADDFAEEIESLETGGAISELLESAGYAASSYDELMSKIRQSKAITDSLPDHSYIHTSLSDSEKNRIMFLPDDENWIKKTWSMNNAFNGCSSLMQFNANISHSTSFSFAWRGCINLQQFNADVSNGTVFTGAWLDCVGLETMNIDVSNGSFFVSTWINCKSLTTANISGIPASVSFASSSLITTESIQYMIEHAAPTTDITITLHADAYARAMASDLVLAALENQPLVTLISA